MKFVSIIYNVIFNLLLPLGFSVRSTAALTTFSLIAVTVGLLIVAPELALFIAIFLLIAASSRSFH
jgi:hypothetical protein